MKFEVDLNDILGTKYGAETFNESIRRQVVENITKMLAVSVHGRIEAAVSEAINEEVKSSIVKIIPEIIDNLIKEEYYPVDRYGDRSKKSTTFRKEIAQAILEQMTYKKTRYSSDQNAFTNAVDAIIKENLDKIKKDFDSNVTTMLSKEAMAYAVKTLQQKLGLSIQT